MATDLWAHAAAVLILATTLAGCGNSSSSQLQERIDQRNEPSRLGVGGEFVHHLRSLPESGSSSRSVWSGNWWPMSAGGTGNAMRKYDAATGNQQRAETWERAAAAPLASVSWAGHCNGLAAAGINDAEPKRSVTYGGQTFTPDDIKAMLVEKWQGVDRVTLVGGRCNDTPATDAQGRITRPACRDINPGALHVVLGNMLGLRREPLVLDITAGDQVWNYPAVSYRATLERVDLATANALTQGSGNGGYAWDPEATQFMKVHMVVGLARGHGDMVLDYILEGKNNQITGGEWIGASKTTHPDFAWTTRNPAAENPYLDISKVDDIARLSY